MSWEVLKAYERVFNIYNISAISLQYELSGVSEFFYKYKNATAHNSQGFSDKNC